MILLDSHVPAWLAFEPDRISPQARARIKQARESGQSLAICDITMLELAMLARKNRIHLETTMEVFLERLESRFRVLPITARACACAAALPDSYPNDPVDRIIGATAIVEGLPLITADRAIAAAGAVHTIW